MATLNWQEQKHSDNAGPKGPNIWFGVSMGLMGIILGVVATSVLSGKIPMVNGTNNPTPSQQQVAQVPSAQPAPKQAPAPKPAPGPLPPVDFKTDHIRGNPKATIAVVEYSDFECPFCQRHHPTMQQIMDTYKDDVVWVYRHFPLSFHPNAQKAAEASECANELGGNDAFWKFTDGVFTLDALSNDAFVTIAKNIGLSEATFKTCLDSGKYAKHVTDEMAAGQAAGVSGTPGNIVVNLKTGENRLISGAVPFASFKTAIDALLDSKPTAEQAPSGSARTITMTAELWKFTPNVVTVKQGEKVTLEVTGVSGTHGLSIPGLGINETIIQGQTVSVDVPTDKVGTLDFLCSIQCGSGHSDMSGKIIIEA